MLKSFASSSGGMTCDEGLSTQFEIRKQEKNSQYFRKPNKRAFPKSQIGKAWDNKPFALSGHRDAIADHGRGLFGAINYFGFS